MPFTMKNLALIVAFIGLSADAQTQSSYGQCAGSGYTGPTLCPASQFCSTQNAYYAQCTPGTAPATTTAKSSVATTTAKPVSTTLVASTVKATTTAVSTPPSSGKVQFAGVNIAGCDFGCDTSGDCTGTTSCPPSGGVAQMQHFVTDDKLTCFRLPVGWQYLVANTLGGTLDPTFFASYNQLVQGCLATGAHCIVDLHNYARWNGGIVGQGGPTNAQLNSVWSQLAAKYANQPNIIFGTMNEPHDLTMSTWAVTLQGVVSAIRAAGATSQLILLPGTNYAAAGGFVANSAPALSTIKDADGTTSKLIYDIHQYLDSDGSGTHADCVTDHVSDNLTPLASYLRSNGRKAFLTETGGGNVADCVQYVCSELSYLNSNADVYLGWQGWAAGGFATSYVLSETPTGSTDTLLVQKCIAGEF
ncbi:hypothetical protein MMC26_002804 [Xylographa opegraphella]|nr:hypothetical protein [Xylographa opegraphella]